MIVSPDRGAKRREVEYGMKRLIALVALVLLIGSIPPTMARHRSVGAEERVAVQPDDEPTVSQASYDTGTSQNCYDPSANVSAAEAQQAATAEGFCGSLIYNADGPDSLEVVSAKDQSIPEKIGGTIGDNPVETFDAVRVDPGVTTAGGLLTCLPLCDGPVQGPLHTAFYDNCNQVAPNRCDNAEDTNEQQRENRFQYFAAFVMTPNAGQFVQKNTDAWDMNGWVVPSAAPQFVAFVSEQPTVTSENQVTPDQLDSIVTGADLPDSAQARICGYSVDLEVESTTPQGVCEIDFSYVDNGDSTTNPSLNEYGDRCNSPTYTCFAASSPAWRTLPCIACTYFGSATDTPFIGGGFSLYGANDQYRTYHFVVAPTTPECPAQEPRVGMSAQGATAPFLAHDLDVYTPATDVSGNAGFTTQPTEDYAQEVTGDVIDTVLDAVNDTLPENPAEDQINNAFDQATSAVNNVTGTVGSAVSDAQNQTVGDTAKADRMEKNANPALNPLKDTSREITHDRTLTECLELITGEDKDTVDDWNNLIDSDVTETATETTLYGNADPSQDDSNNPGPDRISTGGNVGLFADANDDGDYDRSPNDPYKPIDILGTGAYPMLWDHWVTKDGDSAEAADSGSCSVGSEETELPKIIDDMGYGVNTGLFQLVYLQEQTVADQGIFSAAIDNTFYQEGNNIYVLGSQSVKTLWDSTEITPNNASDFALDNQVDQAIVELQNFVTSDKVQSVGQTPDVVVPSEDFDDTSNLESDFFAQCGGQTGDFSSKIQFTHNCQVDNCEGDTVLTQYVFEAPANGQFNGGTEVPAFSGLTNATSDFTFDPGVNTWTDVDPLDGNPDRNDDTDSSVQYPVT